MTQQQYVINRKVNIVELAQTLGNISQACRNLGVSRQHYYDIKSVIAEDGIEGLFNEVAKNAADGESIEP
jgi:molybdenum-dependent DNA-binding transcriptional regulator ModE